MSTASLTTRTQPGKIVATCPACQTRYNIKVTMSGRKAKCGKCQTRMRIPTLRAKLHEAVSKTAQRAAATVLPQRTSTNTVAQTRSNSLANTKSAGTGMLLCGWANLLLIVAAGAIFGLLTQMPEVLLEYKNYAVGGLGFIGLLSLVGVLTCCAAPSESRSRFYILSATFLTLLAIGVAVYSEVCSYQGFEMLVPAIAIQATVGGLSLLAFYCFMIFAAKIGRYIGRGELSATARGVIWIQTIIVAVCCGLAGMMYVESTASNLVLLNAIQIGIVVAAVANLIILTVLQFQLGSALRKS